MRSIYGFGRYFRFLLRRERAMSAVWIVCVAGSALLFAGMYPGLFPDKESMLTMATTMNTPAMVALMGPVYGLESMTTAVIMAQECLIWFVMAVAIMNIFFVNRHTRVDEELGRHEMLRALPVGRLTGAVTTLFGAFALNAVISIITALGFMMLHIEGVTAAGAFSYSLSMGVQGFLFAALTLLAAQLFSTSRGVTGSVFALLGLFYTMRMSGDMAGNALSIISPLGLGLRVYAFYEDNFVPILILLLEAVVTGTAALLICAGRDLGEGILPARKGREHASRFLRGELGLAWRLSRGTIFAWGLGLFALGASYGSVLGQIDAFVNDNEMIQKILNTVGSYDITNNYIVLILAIGAILSSVPVMLLAGRIHAEEKHGRLEQLFAKAVPRMKMFLAYITLALLESFLSLFLLTLGLFTAAWSTGAVELGPLLKAGFAYLPALWVMLSLSVLLVGAFPRLTALVWVVFSYSFLMMYFGRLFDLPEWVHKLSPFGNVPQLPVQEFRLEPLIVMAALSLILGAIGVVRYGRRDIG
ncbi:ABC-2 type transport system permease protein [Kineothrix alysoides]|uniref:ABC-2 type transport system permease protein n=1 Tax=Kineothrix alysoides TaxID=1469948 RepID=A0A4R1QXB1_9FIRM|nr:hypothetical protein [Kineothrix alysoides]TCL57925.1 ABC-2 type transport system permease protein [Kineothrix alysoides]